MEKENNQHIIAIDGYSSCGKSTLAQALADELNILFIDSGAMYRAVTLYAIENNFFNSDGELEERKLEKSLGNIQVDFDIKDSPKNPIILLNGIDVKDKIRSAEVNDKVSQIAMNHLVRKKMVAEQRRISQNSGVVMDGRDIGTVVFPGATLKLFLTASPKIRAKRRFDEIKSKGNDQITLEEVESNLKKRDLLDTTRAESPLKKAEDAILIDNSELTLEEELQLILEIVNNLKLKS